MFKRCLAIILALFLLFSISCAKDDSENTGSGKEPDKDVEKITIGVSVPLTGGSAEQGTRTLRGVTLAVEEFNASNVLEGIEVVIESQDDTAAPQESATIANRFMANENIIAVIGYTQSSCALAAAPIMNEGKLVQICTFSSNVKISDAGPYTFRVLNSDAVNVKFCIDILLSKGHSKIGVLYENNDFGVGCYNIAKDYLAEVGAELLVAEQISLGETKDFSTIITKMKSAGVEAIYAAADETELAMFSKQSHQLDFYPVISSPGAYNPNVIKLGGEDVEGMYGFTFFDPSNMPKAVEEYFERFQERFPETKGTTDLHSTTGYTATTTVLAALKNGARTREEVREYLANLKDFDTMYGKLSYDENGDMSIPLQVIVIKDGKFTLDESSN